MSSLESSKLTEEECLDQLRDFFLENELWDPVRPFVDDKVLLHFVRGRKCNFKKASKSLENYLECWRVKYTSLFKPMRPSNNACIKLGAMRVLRQRDDLGRGIIVIRAAKWDASVVNPDDFIRAAVMIAEELAESEAVEREGFILIVDAKECNWSHVQLWKNPLQVYKALDIVFNTSPLRYNGIHLLNMSFLPNLLVNMCFHLLPWKLKKRVHQYARNASGWAKFHAEFPPSMLPECLGGKLYEDDAFDTEFEKRIYAKEDYYQQISELV